MSEKSTGPSSIYNYALLFPHQSNKYLTIGNITTTAATGSRASEFILVELLDVAMPRCKEGQLSIAELVVSKKDAFSTRHEPALHFDDGRSTNDNSIANDSSITNDSRARGRPQI
ncbi:hypothetical protein VE04_02267 [Pseudogymnoascus sp. 24MN13]|nr:hypothetical protein VE04_02267 [Pseudogymnoascus sp. 24MN13]